jgi:hypothetical protein
VVCIRGVGEGLWIGACAGAGAGPKAGVGAGGGGRRTPGAGELPFLVILLAKLLLLKKINEIVMTRRIPRIIFFIIL